MALSTALTLTFLVLMILTGIKAVAIVPQSEEYVVERLGKFRITLSAGINILVPWLDNIAHKVVLAGGVHSYFLVRGGEYFQWENHLGY